VLGLQPAVTSVAAECFFNTAPGGAYRTVHNPFQTAEMKKKNIQFKCVTTFFTEGYSVKQVPFFSVKQALTELFNHV
jgi:hypothetical protein